MDETSALASLGDGRILAAGRREVGHQGEFHDALIVARARIWNTDEDGDEVDLDFIETESDFGDTKYIGATILFEHNGEICDVRRAVSIAQAMVGLVQRYVAAADLDCTGGRRTGIAVLTSDGKLYKPFGKGGTRVFNGTTNNDLIPVGALPEKSGDVGWIFVGAALGNGCAADGAVDCDFALARVDIEYGKLHKTGWNVPVIPKVAQSVRPRDMALDGFGRPVLVGTAWQGSNRLVAVTRFKKGGTHDTGFGFLGWLTHWFQGHEGDAMAVEPLASGSIAVGIRSVEDLGGEDIFSIAMMQVTDMGIPEWEHSTWAAGSRFTHYDVKAGLDYGYIFEGPVESTPMAIAEDWKDRIVLAGFGESTLLDNPCEQLAAEQGDPSLAIGPGCGGPRTVALGRYLPSVGEPDSRLWVEPKKSRRIMMPVDDDFGAMPVHVAVDIGVEGFGNISIDRKMAEFSNAIDDLATDSFGSYRFPFAHSVLKNGERFMVKTHTLDHHHRSSAGNRYAYDISVRAYDGGWQSTTTTPDLDPEAEPNAKYLAWKRRVSAMAGGRVISCRRTAPDNDPNTFASPDANYVLVQHAFDFEDLSRREFVKYAHFRQDSIPLEVCPDICPVDMPACDVTTEGVDPDGRRLVDWVSVDAGAVLGVVGNSGTSNTPHLHINLTTGAGDGGPVSSGSYPLLFHDLYIESPDAAPGEGAWFEADGKAIGHGMLVLPTQ